MSMNNHSVATLSQVPEMFAPSRTLWLTVLFCIVWSTRGSPIEGDSKEITKNLKLRNNGASNLFSELKPHRSKDANMPEAKENPQNETEEEYDQEYNQNLKGNEDKSTGKKNAEEDEYEDFEDDESGTSRSSLGFQPQGDSVVVACFGMMWPPPTVIYDYGGGGGGGGGGGDDGGDDYGEEDYAKRRRRRYRKLLKKARRARMMRKRRRKL